MVSLTSHSATVNPVSSELSNYKDVTLYYTLTYGIDCEDNSFSKAVNYQAYKHFTAN